MALRFSIHTAAGKTMAIAETPASAISNSSQPSPWHSPVPYLFGGLAAMLGLIAFALLVLACSYWRLSGYLEGASNNERDLESGDSNDGDCCEAADVKKAPPVLEEKFLVIMPGQPMPTCLATPMWSRASSFGSTSKSSSCSCVNSETSAEENKTMMQESGAQVVKMTSLSIDTTHRGGVSAGSDVGGSDVGGTPVQNR